MPRPRCKMLWAKSGPTEMSAARARAKDDARQVGAVRLLCLLRLALEWLSPVPLQCALCNSVSDWASETPWWPLQRGLSNTPGFAPPPTNLWAAAGPGAPPLHGPLGASSLRVSPRRGASPRRVCAATGCPERCVHAGVPPEPRPRHKGPNKEPQSCRNAGRCPPPEEPEGRSGTSPSRSRGPCGRPSRCRRQNEASDINLRPERAPLFDATCDARSDSGSLPMMYNVDFRSVASGRMGSMSQHGMHIRRRTHCAQAQSRLGNAA